MEGTGPVELTREVNGAPAHFVEEGAGPSLLFVHDLMESLVAFGPLVHELGPRYRKVLVDLPGLGKTPVPEGWDYTLASYGAFLNGALRESACRDTTLILHGFGVLVGLEALSVEAGEASRRVSRVVLLNGPLYDDDSASVLSFLKRGPFEALTSAPPMDLGTYRRLVLKRFGDPTYFDEGQVEDLYHGWGRHGPSTVRAVARHLPELREALPRLRSSLSKWGGPVYVYWGEDDPFLGSEAAHRLGREVRRAKVLIFPEVGYLPHEEAPRSISDHLRKVVRVARPRALPPGPSAPPVA
ncbi:MAG: alpha/beta hydrolase [Euryarchaeota archaeon]|nr:alpha/beta hydrolase [Euryarchaeota archaeon]MDE1835624.1 alpha/beta hydrolase [Euryarchaeota archaeon]MDE1878972.1 alpha/beta hydrolase [Euryarchaeota archaeon]MDE2043754.1 alpha/beta hydrolase [Thermoplasmata archaeon]